MKLKRGVHLMATIDIRDNFPTVDIIRFWDNPTGGYLATGLTHIW